MQLDAERFIDLASRPLADNAELELAAKTELEKALAANADHPPTDAADALARADARSHRSKWKVALYLVTLMVSLPLLTDTATRTVRDWGFLRAVMPRAKKWPEFREIPNLTARQKLLLYGDSSAPSASERWKPLWLAEPGNPAYLAEYTTAYMTDHGEISPEILAAAEKADPDNGWFLAQAAVGTAKEMVTRGKLSKKEIADGKAPVFTIHDEKRLNETLDLIHQVVEKPRFTSYQNALFRERIPLFPAHYDYVSQFPLWTYAISMTTGSVGFRKLSDVMAAAAGQRAAEGDTEGFRKITADWHSLASHLGKGGDTLVDLLIAKVMISGPANNFRDSARLLGLEADAVYFEGVSERARTEKERRDLAQASTSAAADLFVRKSSILGGMIISPMVGNQVKSPPPLTDADQLSSRYVDHALFGRALSAIGWMIMGISVAAVAQAPRSRGPLARRLSVRMLDLLHRSDWVWLFVGGLVFPVLWYLWISRLTPFAAREWSVTSSEFLPICGQFGSFLASMIILPKVIAGVLLKKRGAALGLTHRFRWLGWIAAAAVLAAVPLFGSLPMEAPVNPWVLISSLVLAGIVVVWILGGLMSGLFYGGSQSLRQATVARMILPVRVASVLVLALAIPFHYAEERHWVRQDHFNDISTESPALSHYEYLVTQVLRGEVLEMLGDPPPDH